MNVSNRENTKMNDQAKILNYFTQEVYDHLIRMEENARFMSLKLKTTGFIDSTDVLHLEDLMGKFKKNLDLLGTATSMVKDCEGEVDEEETFNAES